MWQIRVKDRGRNLVYHDVERFDDARELCSVYLALGYPLEKIEIADQQQSKDQAA